MELKLWAARILAADSLEEKLLDPGEWTDQDPGPALFWNEPCRPAGMGFSKHSRKDKLPPLHEHGQKDKRAVCLHRFAGHELLAVEIMAYALLAFPDAPKGFRRGIVHTLREEQQHVRLYLQRLEKMGVRFGDLPLYRHFWSYTPHLRNPIQYLSVMSLTFEMANLDFAPYYGASFAKQGDIESAALMQQIFQDELGHVSFGYNWLKKLKPENQESWQTWVNALPPRMGPERSCGPTFFEAHRRMAGIPEEWIAHFLESSGSRSIGSTTGKSTSLEAAPIS